MKLKLEKEKIRTWIFLGIGVLLLVFLLYNQYSNHSVNENIIEESLTEPGQQTGGNVQNTGSEANKESAVSGKNNDQPDLKTILVHVTGEVRAPGVYELESGDRIIDAVHRAGGETFAAEMDFINLAAEIRDGQKIVIPGPDDIADKDMLLPEEKSSWGPEDEGLININQAGQEELQELSGIGRVRAQDIVEYRTEQGPFSSPDELTQIPGIGSKTLDSIRDELTY